ncbi:MAG: hypothetical protein U5J62_08780 [Desulfurivibrio sp.]|nr:hypothetical protein [Desulfurivibrio sp.]
MNYANEIDNYSDLKDNQNFLVSAEPADTYSAAADHKQFSEHVTWGYWAAAFEHPTDTNIQYDINPVHS